MTTTTMHFGPEWMRAKQPASTRSHVAPSPPPTASSGGAHSAGNSASIAPPGASSYSALVTPPAPPAHPEKDMAQPFKYSRDEMLQIWKDGGGRGNLPIEVERWEGVVREEPGEPVCLRELSDVEKKLYAMSLNSELRRRQSTDYMGQNDRPKLLHTTPNHGALRDLGLAGRRRRLDGDQPTLSLARKTSWSTSTVSGSLASPSLSSPRSRLGGASGIGVDAASHSDNLWTTTKRRMSFGQMSGPRLDEVGENPKDSTKIKEEDENPGPLATKESERRTSPLSSASGPSGDVPLTPMSDTNGIRNAVENVSLNAKTDEPQNIGSHASNNVNPDKPQVDPLNYASIQWSYLDLEGNVQGPFPGETMQAWHDQQYFADELMMKRTTIDTDFMSLADIKRRAQGNRIFLSPLADIAPPPGLARQVHAPAPGFNSLYHRSETLDSPSQPAPLSYVRSSTLDSYLASNSGASASPSSSLGGNFSRLSMSPDPMTVGSRLTNHPNQRFAADMPVNGRISAGSYSSNGSPALPHTSRIAFNEIPQLNRTASFDVQNVNNPVLANIPWQTPQMNNGQGWNGSFDAPVQQNLVGTTEFTGNQLGGYPPYGGDPAYAGLGQPPVQDFSHLAGPRFVDQTVPVDTSGKNLLQQNEMNHTGSKSTNHIAKRRTLKKRKGFQQIQSDNAPRFVDVSHRDSLPPLSTSYNHDFNQTMSSMTAPPSTGRPSQPQLQTRQVPINPWGIPPASEPSRPGPFDSLRPNINNVFPAHPSVDPVRSAWAKPLVETRPPVVENVPWLPSQSGDTPDSWPQLTDEPQSLTTANVTQHNEQHASFETQSNTDPVVAEQPKHLPEASAAVSPVPQSTEVVAPAKGVPQSKRKGSSTTQISPAERLQSIPPVLSTSPKTSSTTQKSAWVIEDDAKPKSAMGLREIQEAEKKKQEARKAAEIERERSARAQSTGEEVQFTASWGLPTSRAGTRHESTPSSKEPNTSSTTSSTPVWTNATKPAAKTMKEILEEEERRKLATKEKESVASAAKRAVMTPAAKSALVSPAANIGGAWTVVGASGKVSQPAARPTPPAQTSAPVASTRPTVSTSTRSVTVSAKQPLSVHKADDEPGSPSPEFLKWMRDSLRGLNSSVQFEEIAQMLLSFSLDPDPSTVELIAETVYGASTTLDGRRFASEFIAKRKADISSRSRGTTGSSSTNGKPTSLADVVKSQPKPPQNDFGGYKVVKKKAKGGRS